MKKSVALALLGLHIENPTETQITQAYRSAIQLNHPDRFANNEKLRRHAEEQSKLINEARDVLLRKSWQNDDNEQDYPANGNHTTSTSNDGGAAKKHRNDTVGEYDAEVECPECNANMVMRAGKYGVFYGCTCYPRCKGTQKVYCPICGSRMYKRSGPYGDFCGCARYPECRGKRDFTGNSKTPYPYADDCAHDNSAKSHDCDEDYEYSERNNNYDCNEHNTSFGNNNQAPETYPEGKRSVTPIFDIWETSIGYSVLGVVVLLFLNVAAYSSSEAISWAVGIMQIVFVIFQIVYVFVFYPSLFTKKPKLKSSAAISFWNCAVGGPIFGPIWNSNLTKKTKGRSSIVFAILLCLLIAFWFVQFGFLAAMLWQVR
jgi:ssDNA-binding Zn-finger/Zn-ribbon topoisomerase 1